MQTIQSTQHRLDIFKQGSALLLCLITWLPVTWSAGITTLALNPGDILDQSTFTPLEYAIDAFFSTAPGMYSLITINLVVCVASLIWRMRNTRAPTALFLEHAAVNGSFLVFLGVYTVLAGMILTPIRTLLPATLTWLVYPFNWLFIAPLLTFWLYFWVVQASGIQGVLKRLTR